MNVDESSNPRMKLEKFDLTEGSLRFHNNLSQKVAPNFVDATRRR